MSRIAAKTSRVARGPEPVTSPDQLGEAHDPIRTQCREGDIRFLREAPMMATSTFALREFPRPLRHPGGFPGGGTCALLSGTSRRAPFRIPEDCSFKL
jgi:hypothetical protein